MYAYLGTLCFIVLSMFWKRFIKMIHNCKKHDNRTKKSFLLYGYIYICFSMLIDLLVLYLHIPEVGQQLISFGLLNIHMS